MGGGSNIKPESTEIQLANYARFLPIISQLTANTIPGIASKQLQATQRTQQGYNALNLDQANKFALPLAQVGQRVADSNAQAGAQTNLNQLTGAGGQAGIAATNLNRLTNPDYYRAQSAASRGAESGVNAISLNGLSPGEQNAVERGLNQNNVKSGNLGLINPTNIVSNAMNFGGAFNSKIPLLGQASQVASNVAQSAASNGGVNAPNIALGQPNVSTAGNFGTNTFNPSNSQTNAGSANNGFQFGNNFLQGLTGFNTAANTSAWNYGNQAGLNSIGANSSNGFSSSGCCFIFLEIHNGTLPWYVRAERDYYYRLYPRLAEGYKKMAKWLVPWMKNNKLVKHVVNWTMVKPMTCYGGWKHGVNKVGWILYPVKQLWFFVWNNY